MTRVLLERHAGVVLLELNRPQNANVVDLSMAKELRAAVESLEGDPSVRAVVLTGAGKHFCFGGDLRGMLGEQRDVETYLRELTTDLHVAVASLVHLEAPVIVAQNGTVAGAGVGLLCLADLALCGTSSKVSLAYTGVALTPDAGTSFFLPQLVGHKRAMELLLAQRTLQAQEALNWGLVNRVVEDADVRVAAMQWAATLAAGPRHALGKTKRLLAPSRADLEFHLALESRTIAAQAASVEGLEGMNAFLEKRAPRY
jgi:2-(1,2-epoxy-1,2-dihydrophenyl)acetyl-CoA isomerase